MFPPEWLIPAGTLEDWLCRQKLTEHVPEVNWRNRQIVITIVGCGGTGSQIVTGMPYLHQALLASGHPYGLRVFLIDGDRITETNCVRQPFSRSEVGPV